MPTSDRLAHVALAGLLSLAGCGRAPTQAPTGEVSARESEAIPAILTARAAPDGDLIACQPAGAPGFQRVCRLARSESARGTVLTIFQPSGSFRRLLVLPGGTGLVAADGAERASLAASGPAEIEVTLAGDRFRLPARLPAR